MFNAYSTELGVIFTVFNGALYFLFLLWRWVAVVTIVVIVVVVVVDVVAEFANGGIFEFIRR